MPRKNKKDDENPTGITGITGITGPTKTAGIADYIPHILFGGFLLLILVLFIRYRWSKYGEVQCNTGDGCNFSSFIFSNAYDCCKNK